MSAISIRLAGARVALIGDRNPVSSAALAALAANGGNVVDATEQDPGILLVSYPLVPDGTAQSGGDLLAGAREHARSMAARGGGRMLFLLPALAAMPMRRHPGISAAMAGVLTTVRTLAMEFAPGVLVNAVGFGMVDAGGLISGDPSQSSHTPLARPATIEEAVDPVLFFCDPMNSYLTGQLLAVDGGWSAGYGRNF